MMPAYLPEILEEEAAGTIAQTYAEIRTVLAVPVVNLIYRHLAAEPGRLEATWAALRPNLAHPATRVLAAELALSADRVPPRMTVIERGDIVRGGVSTDDLDRARATLDVYECANGLNLLAVSALLNGTRGSDDRGAQPATAEARTFDILPMADPSSLDGPTRATVDELSAAVTRPDEETLIPSLYRHLASSPPLLVLVRARIGHALRASELDPAATIVRQQAAILAARLPCRVDAVTSPGVRAVLERFAPAMATMLVAGRTINEALGGAG